MTWHPDGYDTVWTGPGLTGREAGQAPGGEPKQNESKPEDGTKRKLSRPEIDKLLTELAVLDDLEYAQRRTDAAKEIGISVAALDREVRKRTRLTKRDEMVLPHWNVEPHPDPSKAPSF